MYCDKKECPNNNKNNSCITKDNSFMWCENSINRLKEISEMNNGKEVK